MITEETEDVEKAMKSITVSCVYNILIKIQKSRSFKKCNKPKARQKNRPLVCTCLQFLPVVPPVFGGMGSLRNISGDDIIVPGGDG